MTTTRKIRLGQGGSLFNRLDEARACPEPQVGMGATEMCYTDRHAHTVMTVITGRSGKAVKIFTRRDKAICTSENRRYSESQTYVYQPGEGPDECWTRRQNGQWIRFTESIKNGTVLVLGYRDEYYDPCF